MRLTLRTLLAWRDGTLPPEHRAEMDDKVAASPAARGLEARIDRLVADGTLPAALERGIAADPNIAAEYLDNVLPVASLDGFELACLDSDPLLAEVAACHRILADISRDPSTLPTLDDAGRRQLLETLRERVAAGLAEPRDAGGDRTAPPAAEEAGQEHDIAALRIGDHVDTTRRPTTVRDTGHNRPRSSTAAWLLAVTAVLLLGALLGTLAWSAGAGKLLRGRDAAPDVAQRDAARQAAAEPGPPDAALAVVRDVENDIGIDGHARLAEDGAGPQNRAAVAAADQPQGTDPPPPDQPARAAADMDPDHAAPGAAIAGVDGEDRAGATAMAEAGSGTPAPGDGGPPPTPVLRREPVPTAIELTATVPSGDALAILAPAPGAPPRPAGAAAAPTPAVPDAAPDGTPDGTPDAVADAIEATGEDVVLVATVPPDGGDEDWLALRAGQRHPLPVRLLAPAFGRPVIDVAGVRLVLSPGTLATVDRDGDQLPRLHLDRGAVVAVGAPGPTDLRIVAGGLEGVATCVAAAPWGVERTSLHRSNADPRTAAPDLEVGLLATNAATMWRQTRPDPAAPPIHAVPSRSTLVWTSVEPEATRVVPRRTTPSWLVSARIDDPVARSAAAVLRQRLPGEVPALPALERLSGDRRAEARIAAAATLSLMGHHDAVARLLVESDPRGVLREGQWAALEAATIPVALASGPDDAARCLAALEAAAPPAAGRLVTALVTDDDALFDDGGLAIADALESPWLVVRRCAWHALCRQLSPSPSDRLRYRPDRPAELNAAGAAWWRERLAESLAAARAEALVPPDRTGPDRNGIAVPRGGSADGLSGAGGR